MLSPISTKQAVVLYQMVLLNLCSLEKQCSNLRKEGILALEELELELIDAGLEEIEEQQIDEDEPAKVFIYGDYTSFGDLQSAIESLGIEVKNASLKRYPTTPVEFNDEQLEEIEKMLDKLEEDDDVQAVYTNIE